MKKMIFGAVMALAFATSAMAGTYAGADIGIYKLTQKSAGVKVSDTAVGGGILAGYALPDYDGANLNLELRLNTTGNFKYNVGVTPVQVRANYAISYLAKPAFDLNEALGVDANVYGMLGMSTVHLTSGAAKATKSGFSYGAGMAYNLDEDSSVAVEYLSMIRNKSVSPVDTFSIESFNVLATMNF